VDKLKLKSAKVVTLAIETAGGKEYHDYVAEAVGKLGGSASHLTVKVTAVDMTPQILEIMKLKPDFITVYGVSNTAILTMKGLAQYGWAVQRPPTTNSSAASRPVAPIKHRVTKPCRSMPTRLAVAT
jgi:hypothetical protein